MVCGPQEHSVSRVLEAGDGLFNHSHLNTWGEDAGEPSQAAEVEALGLGTGSFHLSKSLGDPYVSQNEVSEATDLKSSEARSLGWGPVSGGNLAPGKVFLQERDFHYKE